MLDPWAPCCQHEQSERKPTIHGMPFASSQLAPPPKVTVVREHGYIKDIRGSPWVVQAPAQVMAGSASVPVSPLPQLSIESLSLSGAAQLLLGLWVSFAQCLCLCCGSLTFSPSMLHRVRPRPDNQMYHLLSSATLTEALYQA